MWTEEKVERLKQLWGEGYSSAMIARELTTQDDPVTRNACIGKLHRLGIIGSRPAYETKKTVGKRRLPRSPRPSVRKSPDRFVQKPAAWVPPPKPLEPAPEGGVHLLEVQPGQCRWPMGEPRDLNTFRFCGATSEVNNYCMHHHRISRGHGTIAEQNALKKVPV